MYLTDGSSRAGDVVIKYATNGRDLWALIQWTEHLEALSGETIIPVSRSLPVWGHRESLWAANMKVLLWCWLCCFQLKDGVRHDVYVFTWQSESFNFFQLRSTGNCLLEKQWIKSKALTVFFWLTSLFKKRTPVHLASKRLIHGCFIHVSCGSSSQRQAESNHFAIVSFWCCLFVSSFVSLWNADTTSRLPLIFTAALPVW